MTTELKNLIPTMTSDTAPSGQSFGDGLLDSSLYKYWYAFNDVDSQSWTSANLAFPHYIGYEFTSKTKITQYTIRSRNFDNNDLTAMAKSWEFQGSDDNSNWVTIDTRANIVWTSKAQDINFLLGRAVEYKYYRLKVIENNGYAQKLCTIGQLKLFYDGSIFNRITIKSSTTDDYYSLSENTLIHLPDNSSKNMILHGIEQDKEIQLDVPFDKHRYFNDATVANASGKVFTHDIGNTIGKINTLNIKEFRDTNFEPIYTWYETNMTSATAPSPFVASASSEYNTNYSAWKAFNGSNSTDADGWLTADGVTTGWIQLDFGKEVVFNMVALTSSPVRNANVSSPKDFNIDGSNDGVNYDTIRSITGEENWKPDEMRQYLINPLKKYRYWRIDIKQNNGHIFSKIGEIRFCNKREVK